MFNYIRAEIYKLLRRPYTFIALGVVLVLEGFLVAGFAFHNSHSYATPFGGAATIVTELGAIGFCTCPITGDIVFAGQYKNSTLKNEVSFGLSRARIYLGKLIAQTLLSIAYMVVMLGFYMGVCAAILPHSAEGFYSVADALTIVGYFLAVGLPLWVGGQAVMCMCLFLVHGEIASSFLYVGIVFVLETFLELAGLLIRGGTGELLLKVSRHLPQPILGAASSVVGDWAYLGKAWLVGAFWVIASTAAGLYGFQKKEIK